MTDKEIKLWQEDVEMIKKLNDEIKELKSKIDKAINYIDQVIMYKQVAKEIDKELNELLGILILGGNNE